MTNFSISYYNLLETHIEEQGVTETIEDAFEIFKEIIQAGNYIKAFYVVQFGKVYNNVLPCRYKTIEIPFKGENDNEKN